MIKRVNFETYADLLHFLAENELDQFAVLKHDDTNLGDVIELCYIGEMEDPPILALA